jgi:SAM-dependent methyltransferase
VADSGHSTHRADLQPPLTGAMSGTRSTDFLGLTELAGDTVTREQVERIARRYYWAADYCRGREVLEVACGTGQGVGYLASLARSITAGDCSAPIIDLARRHYGSRFQFQRFDAQDLPFPDQRFDILLNFEALYYIPDVDRFFREARRVLRPGGRLLIATANKDLYDFNPSPHSHNYLGVVELERGLLRYGFTSDFFGDTPLKAVSARQRILRPVKALAARLGLIPKSKAGKKWLKRLVFGELVQMPPEIDGRTAPRVEPVPLQRGQPDRGHKVIFCAAQRGD